jgi:hypothetical protein
VSGLLSVPMTIARGDQDPMPLATGRRSDRRQPVVQHAPAARFGGGVPRVAAQPVNRGGAGARETRIFALPAR